MIKSVTITNYLGDSIELELARPEKSGFIVKSIEGLGPVKATVNMTEVVSTDGSIYNSSRIPTRNILMNLEFYSSGEETIEDVRHKSYRYFPLKKIIKLKIITDNRVCETEGVVESNEPNIFSKNEGCSISILCPDSYFYAVGKDGVNTVEVPASKPSFTFPFSNNSLTEKLIIFGEVNTDTEHTIYYDGDVETGVVISIHASGEASNITITNVMTDEIMNIDTGRLPGGKIQSGDDITISTVKGKKSVTLSRAGKTINVLNCLGKNADWFTLSKGTNLFSFRVNQGRGNLNFSIESRTVYEGV